MPERAGFAEDKRHDWVMDIPSGVSLEQIMEPSYWSMVSAQMDPMDHIEARAEDGSWIAYLIVTICERNYAQVVLDRVVKLQFNDEIPSESIKHRVEWKGPHHKFCVIRLSDSQMLHSGEKSKELAFAWMQNHEKTSGV